MIHFENAVVWRGPSAIPDRGALVIDGDRFADAAADRSRGEGTPRIDLGGAHVLPGFVDCHSHLTVSAWIPTLLDGSTWSSAADAVAAVRAEHARRPRGWIVALDCEDDAWPDRGPTAADLERAAEGQPVLLAHLSLHRGVVSETALRALDLSAATPDPHGEIERGRGGSPGGMLWENAFGRALVAALGDWARSLAPGDFDVLLAAEARRHLSLGITACHDPCVPEGLQPAMERLAETERLRLSWSRVSATSILAPVERVPGGSFGAGPASVKLFLDGAHRCALCLDPSDVLGIAARAARRLIVRADPRGVRELLRYRMVYRGGRFHAPYLRFGDRELHERMGRLASGGARLRIHALGNEAVSQACATLRALGMHDASIEHAMFVTRREIDALATSGTVASVQPGFLPHYGPSILDRGLGTSMHVLPGASLLAAGVPLALSSDNPCGPLDPLHNLRLALSRCLDDGRAVDEREAISVEQAVAAYSVGGRRAVDGTGHGGIVPGEAADFIVLSAHPADPSARPLRTWIAGEEAWRAIDQAPLAPP